MNRKKLILIFIIFVTALLPRIIYFNYNTYNIDLANDSEPWSKINIALNWLNSDDFLPDLNFGPLHTYIISTVFLLNQEKVVFLSRMVSFIFGVLTILLYFFLIKHIYDEKLAWISAWLLSVYPLHINASSVSLAEPIAYFFLLASFYFLCKGLDKNKSIYIVISAISLNFTSMLRFEGWLFVLFFSIFIFLRFKKITFIFYLFLFLSSIFPAIWCMLSYSQTGYIVNFSAVSSKINQMNMVGIPFIERVSGFIWALARGLSFPIFIFCLVGFFIKLKKKIVGDSFFILFTLSLFVYTLRSVRGDYYYDIARYSLPLGLLFIPFGAYAIKLFLENKFIVNKSKKIISVCVVFLCLLFLIGTTKAFLEETEVDGYLLKTIEWLKINIQKNDRVLLETGFSHPFIIMNSGLKERQVETYTDDDFCSVEDFNKYLEVCDYIVAHKESNLSKCSEYNMAVNSNIDLILDGGDWKIFKISL